MICKKCGSEMQVQLVNETKLVKKHKGIIYWLFIGWWAEFIKWMVFTVPALILAIFKKDKYKTKNKQVKYYVCPKCGYSKKA